MILETIGKATLAAGLLLFGYSYFGYPLLLAIVSKVRRGRPGLAAPEEWPRISITVPAYNEENAIRATLERILELDYPADRRQILVVSDASSDRTDEIVREFAGRGVQLLRMPERGGKTAAENAARSHLTGDIVINTDASVRIEKDALKPLIRAFQDPTVGVASGRDISVARMEDTANMGESGYVGYEMWVRGLESEVSGIVGASGCFYAIRKPLHMSLVPVALSRDFAAALIAREHGFRAVSVNDAVCQVPRQSKLRAEYRRKVRTMARGMETLYYRRTLLNPLKDPVFAWMLASHKICRWLTPWFLALGVVVSVVLCFDEPWAKVLAVLTAGVLGLAFVGWNWPEDKPLPKLIAMPTFAVTGNIAAIHAGMKAMRGELNPIWEPTRRKSVDAG
jgi:cellulose synthase/poly-beta-1,6-N-acetylglucosamine synthase-like glycosyltransferase